MVLNVMDQSHIFIIDSQYVSCTGPQWRVSRTITVTKCFIIRFLNVNKNTWNNIIHFYTWMFYVFISKKKRKKNSRCQLKLISLLDWKSSSLIFYWLSLLISSIDWIRRDLSAASTGVCIMEDRLLKPVPATTT